MFSRLSKSLMGGGIHLWGDILCVRKKIAISQQWQRSIATKRHWAELQHLCPILCTIKKCHYVNAPQYKNNAPPNVFTLIFYNGLLCSKIIAQGTYCCWVSVVIVIWSIQPEPWPGPVRAADALFHCKTALGWIAAFTFQFLNGTWDSIS